MDAISIARLSTVHTALRDKINNLASVLPFEIRVTQALRSWNEQSALYEQGRSLPGNIVTNAQPGHSWHNFGLAVDIVPMGATGPDWNINHPDWKTIHSSARALGLTCGADFRTFPDWPHLQLTGRFPDSPDDEVRQLYKDGGIMGVWGESGL